MPQTQKFSQNKNKFKFVSQLGSALGWGKASTISNTPSSNLVSSIYNMASRTITLKEKNDFRQSLLEVRLNDIAQKYCKEKKVPSLGVKVIRVKVTAAKDPVKGFLPVFAEEALEDNQLLESKLFMGGENSPGLIQIFIFEADTEKMSENAPAYQEELNLKFNNTQNLEKALKKELWHHSLLERCRQNGLITADLANLDVIEIIKIHDAFIKSGLLEELLNEREAYLKNRNLNSIDDKFVLYKRALRDRFIKPNIEEPASSELALMADCVQDLFNVRADKEYMSGRVKTIMFCRRAVLNLSNNTEKTPENKFETFMRLCSEHEIGRKTVNFAYLQSKEDHISQSTIETIKHLNRQLFTKRDEDAIVSYFKYDKSELQETIEQTKDSILRYYQEKQYLK